MSTRTQTRHLGEREFLDYPVFLEVDLVERSSVLRRTLLAAGFIALALVAVAAVVR